MVPRAAVVVAFLASLWWSTCGARTILDIDSDDDDEFWPVLCPPDTFYSKKQGECVACSKCPINNIITSPCYGFHDTKCGPFKEYILADTVMSRNSSNLQDGAGKTVLKSDDVLSNVAAGKVLPPSDRAKTSGSGDQTSPDTVHSSESEWRLVTMALVSVIAVFVAVVAFVVVCICFVRRRVLRDKELLCEYRPPPVSV